MDNLIQQKTFAFAIRIVNACKYLREERKEYTLSRQLLRSGTSIGANVEESIGGQSKKDFVAKIFISYKEARESAYWIKLLFATDYITQTMHDSLLEDVQEILKIIGKIISTARKNP